MVEDTLNDLSVYFGSDDCRHDSLNQALPSMEDAPYLLPELMGSYARRVLLWEGDALEQVVSQINSLLQERTRMEAQHQIDLVQRELSLDTALLNLPKGDDRLTLDRKLALEGRLERNDLEKIRVKETAFQDQLELHKLYWHYWLKLKDKTAKHQFLS
jgi:hypothetical protein